MRKRPLPTREERTHEKNRQATRFDVARDRNVCGVLKYGRRHEALRFPVERRRLHRDAL